MSAILDVPEIRARIHLWTVEDYRALAEDNPVFRQPKNGVFQTRRLYGRSEVIEEVGVTDAPVPVEALFA